MPSWSALERNLVILYLGNSLDPAFTFGLK
jgi:hypothetical protein